MKKAILFALVILAAGAAQAQKSKGLDKHQTLTWLGIDFTHLKFIGEATQFGGAGEVTNSSMRGKYFPGWNDLIINEPERYDVAKATGFDEVKNAIDVTGAANNANAKGNYFSDNGNDFQLLTDADISRMVKGYSFKGNSGTGLMIFVEGMDKGRAEASMWVTYVDMGSHSVIATKRYTEKAGGFGFNNYWAATFKKVFKDMKGDF